MAASGSEDRCGVGRWVKTVKMAVGMGQCVGYADGISPWYCLGDGICSGGSVETCLFVSSSVWQSVWDADVTRDK